MERMLIVIALLTAPQGNEVDALPYKSFGPELFYTAVALDLAALPTDRYFSFESDSDFIMLLQAMRYRWHTYRNCPHSFHAENFHVDSDTIDWAKTSSNQYVDYLTKERGWEDCVSVCITTMPLKRHSISITSGLPWGMPKTHTIVYVCAGQR
jgi:hypothetical protein